jgi:hypothetical protein
MLSACVSASSMSSFNSSSLRAARVAAKDYSSSTIYGLISSRCLSFFYESSFLVRCLRLLRRVLGC